MKRSAPLRRTGFGKRGDSKPRPSYENFWRTITNDGRAPCALEGAPCHRCEGTGELDRLGRVDSCSLCKGTGVMPCHFIRDAHHFVPKRRLRTDNAKQDVRNGVCLCRHHHDLVEQGLVRAPRPELLSFFLHDHVIPECDVPPSYEAARERDPGQQ